MCLADRYPGQVGPIILTGVPLLRSKTAGKPALAYRLIRSLNRLGLVSDEKLEEERRSRGSADYRAASGVMRDILVKVVNETYENQLQAVSQPVMMLWGREDTEVPLAVAERALALRLEAGLTASLAVVDGVGHQLPLRAPEELRRLAEKVLA
jgi:pimeloyl-ACP methyl ester carboxylesterase